MPPLQITSSMSEVADPFCRNLVNYITKKLGQDCKFVDHVPGPERLELFKSGEIDMGWICGVEYTKWRSANKDSSLSPEIELLAAPIMIGDRYQEKPVYFSDVVVKKDAPFNSFSDLRNCKWAFNEPVSYSGHLTVLAHLFDIGETAQFFNAMIESGAHTQSFKMVLEGTADAAAIDSTALDQILLENPQLQDKFRVIESLGPSPVPPWVISLRIQKEIRDTLKDILSKMHEDSQGQTILQEGGFSRFTLVDDKDYDPIKDVIQKIK